MRTWRLPTALQNRPSTAIFPARKSWKRPWKRWPPHTTAGTLRPYTSVFRCCGTIVLPDPHCREHRLHAREPPLHGVSRLSASARYAGRRGLPFRGRTFYCPGPKKRRDSGNRNALSQRRDFHGHLSRLQLQGRRRIPVGSTRSLEERFCLGLTHLPTRFFPASGRSLEFELRRVRQRSADTRGF